MLSLNDLVYEIFSINSQDTCIFISFLKDIFFVLIMHIDMINDILTCTFIHEKSYDPVSNVS